MTDGVTRLNILVEGQTEEAFVRDVLGPHLNSRSVFVACRRIETSRRQEKSTGQTLIFRGGLESYTKVKKDVLQWLKEDTSAFLTTMFDIYALPADFPNFDQAIMKPDPLQMATALETAFATDIGYHKFMPYLQLHEYEALLFSDIKVTDDALSLLNGTSRLVQLKEIKDSALTPEHINLGVATAPSKRLRSVFPGYDKVFFGPLIAEATGLATLRQQCTHFNEWVTRLEALH